MTREEAMAENDRIRARQDAKIRECLRFLLKTPLERKAAALAAVGQEPAPVWLDDNVWVEAHLREFTEFESENIAPGDVTATDVKGNHLRVVITETGRKFSTKGADHGKRNGNDHQAE